MHFYLNIGNTHTELGCEQEKTREFTAPFLQVRTLGSGGLLDAGRLEQLEQAEPGWKATACCVVPEIRTILQKRYGDNIHFITWQDFPQIDYSGYDCSTLGADRIANAAGAWQKVQGPVLVVDCGTAINTELLNGQRQFLGGTILPGRKMQRRALAAFTAQLPLIPLAQTPPMVGAAGNNTREAIQFGVDLGVLGAVREIIIRCRKLPKMENCRAIAIGGDAQFFLQGLPELEKGEDNFTIRCLRLAEW